MGLKPVKVGQLNNYINRVLRTDPILGNVSVIGEISNLKFHGSGHVYFSLKDDSSKVSCFIAAGNLPHILCPLQEGMEIIATGYISVYERGGSYSLNIRSAETNGIGQLAVQFEELKQRLKEKGYFDEVHKKPLPGFPKKVAVVTSETGAAVRDIIRTIKNKNNYADILIYPVLVQGPSAAGEISQAIDELNAGDFNVDVIITGRGGGSMEELWAFNEECVAKSIYNSRIPVISAVGHETDFTIADFVADHRAATPTAAAEAAVPDTTELSIYLDELSENLKQSLLSLTEIKRHKLEALDPTSFASGMKSRMAYEKNNIDHLLEMMRNDFAYRITFSREKIDHLVQLLEASSPKEILAKGYSVVRTLDGKIVSSMQGLSVGDEIRIETSGGSASASVTGINRNEKEHDCG